MESALILTGSGPLTFERFLPVHARRGIPVLQGGEDKPLMLDDMVANHNRCVLAMTGGRVHGPGGAAELLGLNSSTLRNKIKKLGISFARRVCDGEKGDTGGLDFGL